VDINTSDTSTPTHNQISSPITRAHAHQLNNQVSSFLASYSSYLDNETCILFCCLEMTDRNVIVLHSRRQHSDCRIAVTCDGGPDHVWTWIQACKYFLKSSWSLQSSPLDPSYRFNFQQQEHWGRDSKTVCTQNLLGFTENQKNQLVFGIKFNLWNLGKENRFFGLLLGFLIYHWFSVGFLFEVQILNKNSKLTGFSVYLLIFWFSIFQNFSKFETFEL
jgi:hypothetical protein